MSITAITIENFRGIAGAVTVPIRPITLLFGKNSAGKSTVLQALHYVREVLEHRRPDPDRTQMGGDYIDMGGFLSLVHRNERDRKIRVRVEFGIDDDGIPNNGITSPGGETEESRELSVDLNEVVKLVSAWIETETGWEAGGGAYIAEYAVGLNGDEYVRVRQNYGMHPELVYVNFEHSVMQAFDAEFGEAADEEVSFSERMASFYELGEGSDDPKIPLNEQKSIIPDSGVPFLVDDDFRDKAVYEDPIAQFSFWSMVGQALTGPLAILLEELRGIRYLGPIREVPPRNYRTPKTPDDSRWANGLGAWDALVRDPLLAEKTSYYMQDVLALGYSINRQERISLDMNSEIVNNLRMIVGRFEDSEADELEALVLEPLEQLPRQTVTQLHDEANHIDIDPSDIGVGISQVIPVVVGALSGSAEKSACRLFAVEQPELHVHPAVQVALGDVFIDGIKNRERTMLIETHSEHLLLRLLRRVRETNEPTLAAKDRGLTSDDLSVVYVLPTPEGVVLTPLTVTDDGDFDEPWPEGFFAERDSELF